MEKSSTFDIADHIYMLQGQLTCINEEASTKNTSLKKNTMGDLLQEISYYEMKADHLMVDYIKIYQENRGQFQSQ